ncbi:metallophosphoesterase family protein [Bacillus kwashiorkori]|uniref:metallophosphoesterase family protein n=1 Tax=Bacillus kwashiorkori TaxID=1522318 RepID=UPI0007850B9A|nr:DNA repair exonuclease [Bacillus kwashiorkori]
MKSIKFIHCADLHLDSPFVGLKSLPKKIYESVKQSTFQSFQKIIDLAIEEKVDFVIIAGDIYDGEDRSVRAQLFFKKMMERLFAVNIPAFIVHGNHDHLGGKWMNIELPSNVHIFPSHVEKITYSTKTDVNVSLYGFSYNKKHVVEKIIDDYKREGEADFHIGLLHGHDSNDLSHYAYAPFTVPELLGKHFNYWALGHVHKTRILHEDPYIVYPGNIQGRHRNETGEKGCYIVQMNEFQTNMRFIHTAPIIWHQLSLPRDKYEQFDELYTDCVKIKTQYRKNSHTFIELKMKESQLSDKLKSFEWDELLTVLREGEEYEVNFSWIYSVIVIPNNNGLQVADSQYFFQEIESIFANLKDWQEPLKPLYNHARAKKYLTNFTTEEQQEILADAKQLLYEYLKG